MTDIVVSATTPSGTSTAAFTISSSTLTPMTTDLVALAASAGPNATISLGPGTFYMPYGKQITPLAGQKWISPGKDSIIDGAVLLTGWTVSGTVWYAPQALNNFTDTQAQCELADNGCQRQEAVWAGSVKLQRVMSLAALVTGTFFCDYTANRVYVFDNPAGKTIRMSKTQTAFGSKASGVLVDGITFQNFANRGQTGMLEVSGSAWEIRNCTFTRSHGWGAGSRGAGAYWHDNRFIYNGQLGLGVPGSNSVMDTRIINNEFGWNNQDKFYQNDWESGGCKVTKGGGLFQGNNVHDENGVGFWADVYANGWTVDNNTFTNCGNGAIRYEISFNGKITNNKIICNTFNVGAKVQTTGGWYGPLGMSAININTSKDVEVSGNTISGSTVINGIIVQVSTRLGQATGWTGAYANVQQGNVNVHHNDVTENYVTPSANYPNIAAGLILRSGVAASYLAAASATFDYNTYRIPTNTDKRFVWTTGYTYSAWDAYRTASGQDAHSTTVVG